jgi:uncharacterized protein
VSFLNSLLEYFSRTNYFEGFLNMLLDIKRVPEGHSVLSQTVRIGQDRAQGLVFAQDVNCRAEIDRIQEQIHILLFYSTVVQVECSRCLAPVECPVKGDARIVLQERTPQTAAESMLEDEVDLLYDDSTEEVDLASIIFDEIMISLPMKPLCSDQCKGIEISKGSVPAAGEKSIDPRWEALQKIKNKNNR